MTITEGYMPFMGYQTYYRIVGAPSAKAPLLLLHGGPGSTHNYFESLDDLAATTGRQIVMYDQLGCGRSSMPDAPELWRASTWLAELAALRQHLGLKWVHLLGQSWGGMLAIMYVSDQKPEGVLSVILASTLSDAKLWAKEQHRLIALMAPADQAAIAQAEASGDYSASAYLKANQRFMEQHAAGPVKATDPEYLRREKRTGTQAYVTAWGPNEYVPSGNLRDYNYTTNLRQWQVPTLITSGTNDLCTPLVAKTMADAIPGSQWTLFADSRHMAFVDEGAAYQKRLAEWLVNRD